MEEKPTTVIASVEDARQSSTEESLEKAPDTITRHCEGEARGNPQHEENTPVFAIKKSDVSLAFMSLGIAVVAFLFFVVATLAVDKFIRKSLVPSFFGYSTLIVTTGSMANTINEGDMIVVKKADEYKIGDIVTFMPEGDTTPTTHRIIRIADGKFYTRGDANNAEDTRPITKDRIVGIVVDTYAHVGLFFTWLTDDFGWMYIVVAICIIVAGILLLKYVSGSSEKAPLSKGATREQVAQCATCSQSGERQRPRPGSCREATEGIVTDTATEDFSAPRQAASVEMTSDTTPTVIASDAPTVIASDAPTVIARSDSDEAISDIGKSSTDENSTPKGE